MPEFIISRPDGSQFKVEATSPQEADKLVNDHIRTEFIEKGRKEFEAAPPGKKLGTAMDDIVRIGADTLSFGFLDKILGGDEALKTEAARGRAGGAGLAADVLTAVGSIPSGVGKAVSMIGGGPLMRGITGTSVGAGEGAIQGALTAAGHDKPIGEGAATGGLFGAAGTAGANVIKGMLDKFGKHVGIGALPPAAPLNPSTSNKVTPLERVETATMRADAQGGGAKAIQKEFKRVSPEGFSPEAKSMLSAVRHGDPGTKVERSISNFLQNPWVAGSPVIAAMTNPSPATIGTALAVGAGAPAVGKAIGVSADQGIKDAAEALRRAMHRKSYEGILSKSQADRLGVGFRTKEMREEEYPYYLDR